MVESERIQVLTNGEKPLQGHYWVYKLETDDSMSNHLSRIMEITDKIAREAVGAWPSDEEWRAILPEWFIQNFRAYSDEEIAALLRMSRQKRGDHIEWEFESWLEAIHERGWEWWSSLCKESEAEIILQLNAWPANLSTFDQIIKASGCQITEQSTNLPAVIPLRPHIRRLESDNT